MSSLRQVKAPRTFFHRPLTKFGFFTIYLYIRLMSTVSPEPNLVMEDLLKLDNQLCFSIYAASRAITRLYRPILDPLDLTYPQYLVLLVLWEKDGGLVSEIGEKLFLDSGTLTPLLKRMESSGYITRVRGKTDERKVEIWLTAKARKLQTEAIKIPMAMAKDFKMSTEELMRTKALVDHLRGSLTLCDEPGED